MLVCDTSRVEEPELTAHPREECGIRFTGRSIQRSAINIQTETLQVGGYKAERRRTST